MEVGELFETSYFNLEFATNIVLQIQAYLQDLTMMLVGNEYERLNVVLEIVQDSIYISSTQPITYQYRIYLSLEKYYQEENEKMTHMHP